LTGVAQDSVVANRSSGEDGEDVGGQTSHECLENNKMFLFSSLFVDLQFLFHRKL
jgi:hypothetical protein